MGIAVSTGAACNSAYTRISHVLNAVRTDENYAKGTIRITFSAENTAEEAEIIVGKIRSILT